MTGIVFEILLILLLIVGNGVFAMSEIAVVSARKTRLQQQVNQGNLGARAALKLANSPSRFLATVQIGITLVGILAGAFGGATIAEKLAEAFRSVPLLIPYSDALAFGIVVICITYLSLVIGELVPKQIALNNPEGIAFKVAQPMQPIDEFQQALSLDKILGIWRGHYQTLGEFIIAHLGRIPTSSDHFEWQGLRFEVMDMDGNRVDKVLITPNTSPSNQ